MDEPSICHVCRGSGLYTVDTTTAAGSHARRCPNCRGKGVEPVAFGSTLRQPEGLNPPELELRSPQ